MIDGKGPDAKIICMPTHDSRWHAVCDLEQLPEGLRDEAGQFFEIYKDLEPGKETSVKGFEGHGAGTEIQASRERFGANRPSNLTEVQP